MNAFCQNLTTFELMLGERSTVEVLKLSFGMHIVEDN